MRWTHEFLTEREFLVNLSLSWNRVQWILCREFQTATVWLRSLVGKACDGWPKLADGRFDSRFVYSSFSVITQDAAEDNSNPNSTIMIASISSGFIFILLLSCLLIGFWWYKKSQRKRNKRFCHFFVTFISTETMLY